MKALTEKILHYVVLIAVTIAAVWVMWKLSSKEDLSATQKKLVQRRLPPVAASKALVEIEPLQVQMCEIFSTFSGKIRAWETYQIGFEVPGRVAALGQNDLGHELDEGDKVSKGQVLATLDQRVYQAQEREAAARVAQASSDLERAERVRQSNPAAITESEIQSLATNQALAEAQHEVTVKNLEDATLRSPVDATISKRMVKQGESVTAHQQVFELVQNGDVLLVVDVPESQIRELEARQRRIDEQSGPNGSADSQREKFRAHVRLEGRNRFGNPWPPLLGEVFHIAEVADPRTGLFEVEVRLSNAERLLRPGMVATADLVTDRIPGYRVPAEAIIYRGRRAHLFTVKSEPTEMELLYWELGPTELHRAYQVNLDKWVDQGPYVVLPASDVKLDSVVVRGHLRLADKQAVRVKNMPEPSPGELQTGEPTRPIEVSFGRPAK